MKFLICGSRDWVDPRPIERVLADFPGALVVAGGARGADSMAAELARSRGHEVDEVKADWKLYGKRAGFIRNVEMLQRLDPATDLVVACWLGFSRGTRHTIRESMTRGIALQLHWRPSDNPWLGTPPADDQRLLGGGAPAQLHAPPIART